MTIRRIDVRTAEVERRVGVCRYPTWIGLSRTVRLFVRGIEHYFRISESQEPPNRIDLHHAATLRQSQTQARRDKTEPT